MTTPAQFELGSQQFWEMLNTNPAYVAQQVATIDAVNLGVTLDRHPALKAWIAASFEAAKIEEARARLELDKAYANALLRARENPDAVTNKAKTVEVLKAEVQIHPEVLVREEQLIQAQHRVGALRAINESLEHRKDMLIQISSNQRKEREAYNAKS